MAPFNSSDGQFLDGGMHLDSYKPTKGFPALRGRLRSQLGGHRNDIDMVLPSTGSTPDLEDADTWFMSLAILLLSIVTLKSVHSVRDLF